MCTVHDASYFEPMQITVAGSSDVLVALLARCCNSAASLTPGNAMFLDGHRAANDVLMYEPDSYPRGFIAPCTVLWVASDLWFWVHPSAADTLATALSVVTAGVAGVKLVRRPTELLRFELRGPNTARMLDAVLQPLELTHESDSAAAAQRDEWRVWRALRSMASLPDGCVLPLMCVDPRIAWPPKKNLSVTPAQHAALAMAPAYSAAARSPLVLQSPLWSADERHAYASGMDTQHQINRARSHSSPLDASQLAARPVPVVLVVRRTPSNHGSHAHAGQGGIDLYLPRGAGAGVWHALTFAGARAIGQVQRRSMEAERGALSFPHDAVDSGAGVRFAKEVNDAARAAHELRPVATKINHAKLGDPHALGDDWSRIARLHVADEALGRYYVVRERVLLERLRAAVVADDGRLPHEDAGALVSVNIRTTQRGTVDYNAAICVPSAAMLANLQAGDRNLPTAPTSEYDAAVVIGRVTSDRGYLLSQGNGGGVGALSLTAWLKFRRAVEAVHPRFRHQLLLKNIQTATYRVVMVEAIR
jgi:hypothetical protein